MLTPSQNKTHNQHDEYRISRIAYNAEAAFEYFISLLVTTEFLAALLKQTGVSDSHAGIISSVASFACISQLITLFFSKSSKNIKRNVTLMHLVNQLMFVSLYMIPFINIPHGLKEIIFVVMILGGHIIENCALPSKLSWMMSFVDNEKRGIFTANKEIISLISGMLFSLVMGNMVDSCKEAGNEELGFILCGVTIFVLTILHLSTLLIAKPPKVAQHSSATSESHANVVEAIKSTFCNPYVRKIIVLDTLWQSATVFSISYFGVYLINSYENAGLGLTLSFVAGIKILHSFARMSFSRFFGRLADKTSWANMLSIAVSVASVGFLINCFTVPSSAPLFLITLESPLGNTCFSLSVSLGVITYTAYYLLYAISLAGVNSGRMNLVFDYVNQENRAYALAVKSAISGVCGFASAILGGLLLNSIQQNQNTLFGLHVYPQQVLSFVTFVILTFLVFYTRNAFPTKQKVRHKDS